MQVFWADQKRQALWERQENAARQGESSLVHSVFEWVECILAGKVEEYSSTQRLHLWWERESEWAKSFGHLQESHHLQLIIYLEIKYI